MKYKLFIKQTAVPGFNYARASRRGHGMCPYPVRTRVAPPTCFNFLAPSVPHY